MNSRLRQRAIVGLLPERTSIFDRKEDAWSSCGFPSVLAESSARSAPDVRGFHISEPDDDVPDAVVGVAEVVDGDSLVGWHARPAMVQWAMVTIMTRRLARHQSRSRPRTTRVRAA